MGHYIHLTLTWVLGNLTLGPHVYAPNALATETSPKTLFGLLRHTEQYSIVIQLCNSILEHLVPV